MRIYDITQGWEYDFQSQSNILKTSSNVVSVHFATTFHLQKVICAYTIGTW